MVGWKEGRKEGKEGRKDNFAAERFKYATMKNVSPTNGSGFTSFHPHMFWNDMPHH